MPRRGPRSFRAVLVPTGTASDGARARRRVLAVLRGLVAAAPPTAPVAPPPTSSSPAPLTGAPTTADGRKYLELIHDSKE